MDAAPRPVTWSDYGLKDGTMRTLFLAVLLAGSLPATSLQAGEWNEKLSIGDAAPGWEDLPGTDGMKHSLKEYEGKDAVVLVFTCLSCPYAVGYEDRINNLAKQHAGPNGKIAVVAVCVNQIAADRLDKLTARAKEKEFAFPILYDESQKIAHDYGAIYTPEVYVLNKERKVVYMGAFDDSAEDSSKVRRKFVEDALASSLKGEIPLIKETVAVGCRVRYARKREKTGQN